MNSIGLEGRTGYEIMKAIDGRNIPSDVEPFNVYSGWNIESENNWWNRDVLPGEVGCCLSHIEAWKAVANGAEDSALILEEDFYGQIPVSEINVDELNQVYPDWDLLYLSRNAIQADREEEICEGFMKPLYSYNAHAYILTKEGARKLLNTAIRQNIITPDEFLPAMYCEHPRKDMNELYPNKTIKAAATVKSYIGQSSTPETSTVGHGHGTEVENRIKQEQMENQPYYEILDTSDWDAWKEKYVNNGIMRHEFDLMVDDIGHNIYEFPLFTEKFCREAIALSESLDKWTVDRHDNYPTNDVLLQDIGLQDIYARVLKEIVYPLCIHLWTLEGKSWPNMVSENFLARYTTDRQSHLSLHHDFSHITMVVKLNDEFDGGGTWFPGYNILSNPERVGVATLHPGMITHLHGARPIYSGKRYICVSFMRRPE